jgi:hypothetical protein
MSEKKPFRWEDLRWAIGVAVGAVLAVYFLSTSGCVGGEIRILVRSLP